MPASLPPVSLPSAIARRIATPPDLKISTLRATLPTITFTRAGTTTITSPVTIGAETASFLWNAVAPLTNIGGSGAFGSTAAWIGVHSSVEVWSDAALIDFNILGYNTGVQLFVDGQRIQSAQFGTDSSGANYLLELNWGGVKVPRNYKFVGVNFGLSSVLVSSTDSVWLPTYPRAPLAFVLGDSYTYGNGTSGDITTSFCNVMCGVLGMECIPDGIGGTGWTTTGANLPQTRVTSDLLNRMRAPDYVFTALGYNDAGGNMTTLSTNYTASIAAIRAGLPNTKIITLGPWTPSGGSANITTVSTTLQTLAASQGSSFVDASGIFTVSNWSQFNSGDNVHPNNAGHAILGGRMAERVLNVLK